MGEESSLVVEEVLTPEVQKSEVVEIQETTDSPGKVEVEVVDDELEEINSLDDLDETKESIWDKMKFWKKDSNEVKEIG